MKVITGTHGHPDVTQITQEDIQYDRVVVPIGELDNCVPNFQSVDPSTYEMIIQAVHSVRDDTDPETGLAVKKASLVMLFINPN
jgi:hypothetical protein